MKNRVDFFLKEVDCSNEAKKFEGQYGLLLPEGYLKIISEYDGAMFEHNKFNFRKGPKTILDSLGDFLCWKDSEGELLERTHQDPPEFFPKGLLAFASNGGGDYLCFDYRKVKKDPPIVIWLHEEPEGEDVAFVANSFEEFIDNLKGDDELDK